MNEYADYFNSSLYFKGGIFLIAITKEEAKALRERFKDVHIVRTCKQKSKRHHYFAVEDRGVGAFIRRLRGERR